MDRIILETRLVEFSTQVLNLCRKCKFDDLTIHLSKQIVRSSSSVALNYAEARSAESRADFVHKLSLVLKELRETQVNLQLLQKAKVCKDPELLTEVLKEASELVAIFQKSINTLINGKK